MAVQIFGRRLGEVAAAIVDPCITFAWRLFCRHEWRKDEVDTRRASGHPLIPKMFVRGFCRKCGKRRLLTR